MSESSYPHVFKPITIGPVEVSNRMYFSPHGVPTWVGDAPSIDGARYWADRAVGGCGMIMTANRLRPAAAGVTGSYAVVADLVHEAGAKLFGQLTYSVVGGGGLWEPLAPERPVLGPSAYQRFDHYATARAMTKDEVLGIIDQHRVGARNLAEAGYDGIEIHLTHGMIGEQFLSAFWNRRDDEYGGSVERRLAFPIELLHAVRESADGMAVGIRFNCDEMLPDGWDSDEAQELLTRFVESGLIDFADLDVAVEPHQFPLGMPSYLMPRFSNESFVAAVRGAAADIPVFSALGRVTTVADAERAISSGVVDLVGVARGLIAEPELMNHAREGREADSRACTSCNYCMMSRRIGGNGCSINPGSGRESRWGIGSFAPATLKRRVVVVGGGAGGAEAARVAALRGHEVTLFERADRLGGQLGLWSVLPDREIFGTTAPWYQRQLDQLGVTVKLEQEVTAGDVLAEQPDAVIVATGSHYDSSGASGYLPFPIPGHDRDFVYTVEQVLAGGQRPTGKVIILEHEGINTGAGIAELLAQGGADVEIITRWLQPVQFLFETLEFAFIVPRLKGLGVTYTTATNISEIGDHTITAVDVFTSEEREITGVDALILATGRMPVDGIARELEGEVTQLFTIGDALAPRGLAEATFEGHKFARMIGEPDAPTTFAEAYFAPIPTEAVPRAAAAAVAARA
jgi:2,4-dienoyl-CoA reductase-like NADH-dependent reductase (Old Yellow Enzyme family)